MRLNKIHIAHRSGYAFLQSRLVHKNKLLILNNYFYKRNFEFRQKLRREFLEMCLVSCHLSWFRWCRKASSYFRHFRHRFLGIQPCCGLYLGGHFLNFSIARHELLFFIFLTRFFVVYIQVTFASVMSRDLKFFFVFFTFHLESVDLLGNLC